MKVNTFMAFTTAEGRDARCARCAHHRIVIITNDGGGGIWMHTRAHMVKGANVVPNITREQCLHYWVVGPDNPFYPKPQCIKFYKEIK